MNARKIFFAVFFVTCTLFFLVAAIACDPAPVPDEPEPPPVFRVSPSSGCELPSPSTASGTFQVVVGGVARNFRVDAPPGWDGSAIPIVYTFHACGGNEQNGTWNGLYNRTNQSQWLAPDLAPYPVLVIHGDALGSCWDVAPSAADLPYYDAVRAAVESSYCIDGERRYHAGMSSGAFAAQAFACRRDGVAAVWAALGGMHHATNPYGLTVHALPEVGECNGPVPVMVMASTTDTLVPPNTYTRPARDRWLEINDCDPESGVPYTHVVPAAGVGGNACTGLADCVCLEYTCAAERTVWCEYTGSGTNGHAWPGYYRDAAANWLGRFVDEPGGGGESSSSSSGAPETSSSTGEPVCEDPCEMVCQCP
jgi:hypothetical protein